MEKPKIIAAGGLVTNPKAELLLIFRRGYWDLPKGKLDDGETIETCAVREVQEETGLKTLALGSLVGVTLHEYFDKWTHRDVVKETHWFEMKALGTEVLIPQKEEDIEQILWAAKAQMAQYMNDTYANIITIVRQFGYYG